MKQESKGDFIVGIILLTCIVMFVFMTMQLIVNQQIQQRINEILVRHGKGDKNSTEVDRIYFDIADQGQIFAQAVEKQDVHAPEFRNWLSRYVSNLHAKRPEVMVLVVATEEQDMMLLARWRPSGVELIDGNNYQNKPWYRDALLSGHGSWHEPFQGDFIKDPIAVYAIPYQHVGDSKFSGVCCVDISLGFMGQLFARRFQIVFILVSACGFVIMLTIILMFVIRVVREHVNLKNKAKQLNAEMETAHTIQTSVLPAAIFENDNASIAAAMFTAKEVGGDFYDYFMLGDNRLAALIADVSGKGITAALFMMNSKAIIREELINGKSLEEAFIAANLKLTANNDAHMFLTAFLVVLDLASGEISCINAGHNPPLMEAGGKWNYLKIKHSVPLGLSQRAKYVAVKLQMEHNDTIFLYTDGVTEAMNPQQEQFGENRLLNELQDMSHVSPQFIDDIRRKIDIFADKAPQSDDITILTLTRK